MRTSLSVLSIAATISVFHLLGLTFTLPNFELTDRGSGRLTTDLAIDRGSGRSNDEKIERGSGRVVVYRGSGRVTTDPAAYRGSGRFSNEKAYRGSGRMMA
ncbi:MAG: hypothetical protein AAF579_08080 [Cyanobacteria bacterium P01_C01_bin.118]